MKEEGVFMVDLKILEGLSFHGAEQYLIESGYVQKGTLNTDSDECDVIEVYPYFLYDDCGNIIDKVGHAEYCMIDTDGELDDFACKWIRLDENTI